MTELLFVLGLPAFSGRVSPDLEDCGYRVSLSILSVALSLCVCLCLSEWRA